MFDEQHTRQSDILQDERPDLDDPFLCTYTDVQRTPPSASDASFENNADMFLLWGTLTDIAHSDNGKPKPRASLSHF
jgi:hypothetical protein